MNLQMVDLQGQYTKMQNEIDQAVLKVVRDAAYINGPEVKYFQQKLQEFMGSGFIIPCANGTDALQIALMALDLKQGDEIIIPAFTYVATAEVIALLGLVPVMVDVDPNTFNINPDLIEQVVTPKTKAIIPVHLFGQSADMEPIMQIGRKYNLWVIEDNAQSLGAEYVFANGTTFKTGTIGHIGCTSFFPTKNLGCFGDGGAISTNDEALAVKIRMIANHGQKIKYHHALIGCNSRLDTLQAAVLNVKINYLNDYIRARQEAAAFYDKALAKLQSAILPQKSEKAKHTYNQYTLRIKDGKRDELKAYLTEKGIPSMIYYPLPLYQQEAFNHFVPAHFKLEETEQLCQSVLSIPMHTELTEKVQQYVCYALLNF